MRKVKSTGVQIPIPFSSHPAFCLNYPIEGQASTTTKNTLFPLTHASMPYNFSTFTCTIDDP